MDVDDHLADAIGTETAKCDFQESSTGDFD
jgi:hypothetical protein